MSSIRSLRRARGGALEASGRRGELRVGFNGGDLDGSRPRLRERLGRIVGCEGRQEGPGLV